MKRPLVALAALCASGLVASAAYASLPVGAPAPMFTGKAGLAGHEFDFSLKDALSKGPVVLYFFPAAFTSGCTKEAHDFAEATEDFHKLGATVVGVTAGNHRAGGGVLQGGMPRQVRRGRRPGREDQRRLRRQAELRHQAPYPTAPAM